jgi:glycosyltransferase involved in cell wall biosynthesis
MVFAVSLPVAARITVVTSGHVSTCPRMLKSADALADAGYQIRVVSTRHEPWASETDADVRRRRHWAADVIDYGRTTGRWTYWLSGIRHRAARLVTRRVGVERSPLALTARAFGRVHAELANAAAAAPADLIYGGTTGALAATAEAARRLGVPYALDLEDFHSAETDGADAAFTNALARRIERSVLGGASFLTTASLAIAGAYRDRYHVSPTVINNTFPLPATTPDFSRPPGAPLRLYWFSQTIGPGRGLEDAVAAMGTAGVAGELHLRGRPLDGYIDTLAHLARTHAPRLSVVHHPPAAPDAMIDVARGYDVGLALEQMAVVNRQLCLTNKAFTYVLAGVAVAITDTPGQHALGVDLGAAAALVPPGDVDALARVFARWAADGQALEQAKRAAWAAAVRRWHWEHDEERGALYRLVAGIVG